MAFSSRHHKASHGEDLRTRTPQGDGNDFYFILGEVGNLNLRTRTPQGDGNQSSIVRAGVWSRNLRTRTPQGDGNL